MSGWTVAVVVAAFIAGWMLGRRREPRPQSRRRRLEFLRRFWREHGRRAKLPDDRRDIGRALVGRNTAPRDPSPRQLPEAVRRQVPIDLPPMAPATGLATPGPTAFGLAVGSRSSAGRLRRRNEDFSFVEQGLAVVADGVGGRPAGDLASRAAVEAAVSCWRSGPADLGPADRLRLAVDGANSAVLGAARDDLTNAGMATTLDIVGVVGSYLVGAHVGDGAVWLLKRDAAPLPLTKPHSASAGPLLRAVGSVQPPTPDLWRQPAAVGDRLVLATDGLTADLGDRVVDVLHATRPLAPQDAADRLVTAALDAGGADNVTVVVADVEALPAGSRSARPQAGRRNEYQTEHQAGRAATAFPADLPPAALPPARQAVPGWPTARPARQARGDPDTVENDLADSSGDRRRSGIGGSS
jgi:PPM family protein phosphatase